MKTLNTLTLAITATLVGGLLSAGGAIAAPWVHHGALCHNYNAGQANDFDFYTGNGIVNTSTGWRTAVCPFVSSQTSGLATGSVTLQVNNSSGAAFTCYVYTYDWNDSYKGSTTISVANGATIASASNIPNGYYYRHALTCSLPPNRTGSINGIESNF